MKMKILMNMKMLMKMKMLKSKTLLGQNPCVPCLRSSCLLSRVVRCLHFPHHRWGHLCPPHFHPWPPHSPRQSPPHSPHGPTLHLKVPHSLHHSVNLPLSLVIKPCPPVKDADFKVFLHRIIAMINITKLFSSNTTE